MADWGTMGEGLEEGMGAASGSAWCGVSGVAEGSKACGAAQASSKWRTGRWY
jgi:hypothetical protein